MGKIVRLRHEQNVEALLELFLFEKKAEGKAERTIWDYEKHVTVFFRKFPFALSSEEALRRAVLEYFAEPVKPATFNIRRAYLKAFFAYLVREGVIEKNPVDFARRKDEGKARAVPEGALQKLLEAPDKRTWAGLRDYVLILFMLDAGISLQEVLSLFPNHFNLRVRRRTVPDEIAKTKANRIAPPSPVMVQWIKKFSNVRSLEWKNTPVFCSENGEPSARFLLELLSLPIAFSKRSVDTSTTL